MVRFCVYVSWYVCEATEGGDMCVYMCMRVCTEEQTDAHTTTLLCSHLQAREQQLPDCWQK